MTSRHALRLALFVLLLTAPDPQGEPAAAPAGGTKAPALGLLIWGGGTKPEDAAAAAQDFERSGLASSAAPTILFSSDVKGLNPGFHVAVLGACPRAKAEKLLQTLRLFQGGAYVRYVPAEGAVAELPCPALRVAMAPLPDESVPDDAAPDDEGGESGEGKPQVTVRVKAVAAGKYVLRAKLTETDESSSGEEDVRRWSAVIELYRGKTLLSSEELSRPAWAVVDRFEAGADGLALDTKDMDSDCGSGDVWDGAKVHRVFRIDAGAALRIVTDTSEEPEFGLCPPNPEGADPQTMRCRNRRFEALEPACKGAASKDRCLRAVAKYDASHPRCW